MFRVREEGHAPILVGCTYILYRTIKHIYKKKKKIDISMYTIYARISSVRNFLLLSVSSLLLLLTQYLSAPPRIVKIF